MGFVLATLSTIFAFQSSLRGLQQLLVRGVQERASASDTNGGSLVAMRRRTGAASVSNPEHLTANQDFLAHQRSDDVQPQRPLRGNWPFTVRPPVGKPKVPSPPPHKAGRAFLPMSATACRRTSLLVGQVVDVSNHRPAANAVKRVSDMGSGRLVIAGRMTDVCAELDRMAASEALQA